MGVLSAGQYDHGWELQWDDMKKYGPFARHLRRLILSMIQPFQFDSVLDVSCGQGALLMDIAERFPHVQLCGTELSAAALTLTRQRLPHGQFWPLDLEQACLPQQFDLVTCSEVLEHILDDVAAIQHLAAMTRRYVLISVPQGRMRSREPAAFGHVRNYARGELVQKLEHAQLRVVRTLEWGFPFYSPLYRDLMNLTGGKGTTGRYSTGQKLIAQLVYAVFRLNSARRGDELVVLAERHLSGNDAHA
ncbi:MAG: class I SAM-dependent methyltransferase [Chloroflexi bacterium]|nr:class I SAM-dependent methyltransferase [Chloroflexota bacterium]